MGFKRLAVKAYITRKPFWFYCLGVAAGYSAGWSHSIFTIIATAGMAISFFVCVMFLERDKERHEDAMAVLRAIDEINHAD
jgi:hypothetical protein